MRMGNLCDLITVLPDDFPALTLIWNPGGRPEVNPQHLVFYQDEADFAHKLAGRFRWLGTRAIVRMRSPRGRRMAGWTDSALHRRRLNRSRRPESGGIEC